MLNEKNVNMSLENIQGTSPAPEELMTRQETAVQTAVDLLVLLKRNENPTPHIEFGDPQMQEQAQNILKDMPKGGSQTIYAEALKLQNSGTTKEGILANMEALRQMQMLGYKDDRDYIKMYNRKFADSKLTDAINALVEKREAGEHTNFSSIARLNFDMNGLKALNDLGGHSAGNEALMLFSTVLREGKTTQWLKDKLGIEVTASAEGGDEFGIILSGDVDLTQEVGEGAEKKELQVLIQTRYFEEINSIDSKDIIDFSSIEIREKLFGAGIDISPGFTFEISASVGMVLFDEALMDMDADNSDDYSNSVKKIANAMFAEADKKAIAHKDIYKNTILAEKNPELLAVYAWGREDSSEKISDLTLHIKVLEQQLENLREDRVVNESSVDDMKKIA